MDVRDPATHARVVYTTSDQDFEPVSLTKLYFCVHCVKLKSRRCVLQELDTLYLPNELESVPTSDALMRKNRASNSYVCPLCHNSLQVTASSISTSSTSSSSGSTSSSGGGGAGGTPRASPTPQAAASTQGVAAAAKASATPVKKFTMHCLVCQWMSRDARMDDANVASGGWQNTDPEEVPMVTDVLTWYRKLLDISKMEAEKGKRKVLKKRISTAEKTGKGSVATASAGSISTREKFEHASVPRKVDDFPKELYNDSTPLHKITTLYQRFQQPLAQPRSVSDLLPRRSHLVSKCSMRCRECEHNLCKPNFNPTVTKFKIHLIALHYVPNLRLVQIPSLNLNEEATLIMSLNNPLPYAVHVSLLPLPQDEPNTQTVEVHLPESALFINAREDLDSSEEPPRDDPKVIHSRKECRVEFYVRLKPLIASKSIEFGCILEHDYHAKSSIGGFQSDAGQEDDSKLRHHVLVTLGPVVSS